jgi:hypothetical protein
MIGETADRPFDRLIAVRHSNQVELAFAMVKALRRSLETSGLFAIAAGVPGGILLLSIILVFGGYLIVRALS